MDCYFHSAVPAVGRCSGCGKAICASCRSGAGDCPSCRLGARIEAAGGRFLKGSIGPRRTSASVVAEVRPESRALAALGYPFWPIALIALFDPSRSPFVRRNAWQALGFNFGMYGFAWLLSAIASIPFVGISAWPLLPFIVPVTLVASVVFAFKAWHGEEVRVPLVSDWLDRQG